MGLEKKTAEIKKGSVKLSLRAKLIVPLVLIITLVLVSTGAYNIASTRSKLVLELENTAELTSNQLSVGLANSIWNLDRKTIESQVDGELEDPETYAISVLDEYGDMLLAREKDSNGKIVDSDGNMDGIFFSSSKEVVREGHVIGSVDVYLTDSVMLEKLNQRILEVVISTILVDVAILLILFFMINKFVLASVNDLIGVANRLYESVGVEEPRKVGDEIQTLKVGITGVLAMVNTLLSEIKNKKGRGRGK